jgi:hypothetical protein
MIRRSIYGKVSLLTEYRTTESIPVSIGSLGSEKDFDWFLFIEYQKLVQGPLLTNIMAHEAADERCIYKFYHWTRNRLKKSLGRLYFDGAHTFSLHCNGAWR